ncbi:uncharacterized protein LOC120294361 [Eucalyptus grandis]|uniref:uncharacterized protein LOC120294361 n=1 Tax=Eucalyptus grandis TaxID=71139 RepID=UPI00192E9E0B|nr:uncharacterized protein LOC120294361 [Eucalyptus grandis]
MAEEYAGKIRCFLLNTNNDPDIAEDYDIKAVLVVFLLFNNGQRRESVLPCPCLRTAHPPKLFHLAPRVFSSTLVSSSVNLQLKSSSDTARLKLPRRSLHSVWSTSERPFPRVQVHRSSSLLVASNTKRSSTVHELPSQSTANLNDSFAASVSPINDRNFGLHRRPINRPSSRVESAALQPNSNKSIEAQVHQSSACKSSETQPKLETNLRVGLRFVGPSFRPGPGVRRRRRKLRFRPPSRRRSGEPVSIINRVVEWRT